MMTPLKINTAKKVLSLVGVLCIAVGMLAACRIDRRPPEFARAQALTDAGHTAEAHAVYRELAQRCRASQEICLLAQLRLAQSKERLARDAEAARTYAIIARTTARTAQAASLVAGAIRRWARLHERRAGDTETATHLYHYLINRFPNEPAAEQALAAVLRLHAGQDAAARLTQLAAIYQRTVDTAIAPTVLFRAAEIYAEQRHLATAIALYQMLAADYPMSRRRQESLWRAAFLSATLKDWDQALTYAYRLLATHRRLFLVGAVSSPRLAETQWLIGRIYLDHLDQPNRAIAAFQALRRDFPFSRLGDDAQWGVAQSYFRQGRLSESCAALTTLIASYPRGNHVRRARAAQRKYCAP